MPAWLWVIRPVPGGRSCVGRNDGHDGHDEHDEQDEQDGYDGHDGHCKSRKGRGEGEGGRGKGEEGLFPFARTSLDHGS